MKEIGLFEAKTKLSEICAEVEAGGESIILTRRGRPIAQLGPIRIEGKKKSVWESTRDFWKGNKYPGGDFQLPPRQLDESKDLV